MLVGAGCMTQPKEMNGSRNHMLSDIYIRTKDFNLYRVHAMFSLLSSFLTSFSYFEDYLQPMISSTKSLRTVLNICYLSMTPIDMFLEIILSVTPLVAALDRTDV
jgi:hypothetical protein